MLLPFVQGFGMGGGLIVAIGAQNAFVLSQGVRRNHHIPIACLCSLCDALLIALGVLGMGSVVNSNPEFAKFAAWGGAAFLLWYGFGAFRSALRGGRLEADGEGGLTLRRALLTTLAVSLLNPHAYLDTIVLLGGISGRFAGEERYLFGLGAIVASMTWFFALSFGSRLLAPLFKSRNAWRVLDGIICVTMWLIAVSLLRGVAVS